jgi:DNA-binding response OmpR family regulator
MLTGKSILLVDDEAGIRRLAARAVAAAGGESYGAANGVQALVLLERFPIDLAVVDILMPQKEGIETIMELKPRWPSVKVIAISGGGRLGAEEFLALASQIGADATMKKPLSFKDLVAMIAFLLDHETAGAAVSSSRWNETFAAGGGAGQGVFRAG